MTAGAQQRHYDNPDRRAEYRERLHFEYWSAAEKEAVCEVLLEDRTAQLEEAIRAGREAYRQARMRQRRIAKQEAEIKHLRTKLRQMRRRLEQ